jgi:uncharacterized protein YbgA (DUF1722 family)/uncharacterized protein YbbK (DUF523 family)
MDHDRVRLGVSSCLLGDPVRFDGGHKRDSFVVESLGRHVEWVSVCPEVESGMATPREALRLVARDGTVRLRTAKTNTDLTQAMQRFTERRLDALEAADLSGFVLKKDSPSCGLERVKVYGAGGVPVRSGRGVFADALVRRFPGLPIEDEGRLRDARLCENFVERIFAYRRLSALFRDGWSTGDLVRFHTAHKLTLLAHQPVAYSTLGRLVAAAASMDRRELQRRYTSPFMAALATLATPPRHANVLQHMLGYFKRVLDDGSRAEVLDTIRQYVAGVVPLVVPLTLFAHHVRRHSIGYLSGQTYMRPYPMELMLRNRI